MKLHLDANKSENSAQADHSFCSPLPHAAFKTPSLKAFGEFGSFELELPILLVWHRAINATFLHHNLVSIDWLYCVRVSGLKFGQVTNFTYVYQFITKDFIKDTNEQPDEEIYRVRSRSVPSAGVLCPWSWGIQLSPAHG